MDVIVNSWNGADRSAKNDDFTKETTLCTLRLAEKAGHVYINFESIY
jgi:hypothetical protein